MTTEELVRRFEAHDLAPAEWDHRAHLRAVAWLVYECGADQALDRFRAAVQGLNLRHGVPQTPTGGYHETLTRAYVLLTAAIIANLGPDVALDVAEAEVVARLTDKTAVLAHYSRELVMSPNARYDWVQPDLAPLPVEGSIPHLSLPAQGDDLPRNRHVPCPSDPEAIEHRRAGDGIAGADARR